MELRKSCMILAIMMCCSAEGSLMSLRQIMDSVPAPSRSNMTLINGLYAFADTLVQELQSARDEIRAVRSDMSAAKTDAESITAKQANMSGRIQDLQSSWNDIRAVQSDVNAVKKDVGLISAMQANMSGQIQDLQSSWNDIHAVRSDVNAVKKDVVLISTMQANMSARVNLAETGLENAKLFAVRCLKPKIRQVPVGVMKNGDYLNVGEKFCSETGTTCLFMQPYGDVVLYETMTYRVLWNATPQKSSCSNTLSMQGDGNLCLYNSNGPMWCAWGEAGMEAAFQSDGHLCLRLKGQACKWSTRP